MNLRELCHDRELVTPELHASNDFYGHAALVKRYVGRPALSALKVAIEHGVILNDYVWDNDVTSDMPLFLCANPRRAELFTAKGTRTRAVPIGPMPYYAAAMMPAPVPSARRTLLVFPSHSSHRVRAEFDAGAFADRIVEHGKQFDDVAVCVYWRDVERGLDRTFAQRGFSIVSAGHMYDPAFLPRLLTILRGAAAVLTNEVGSAVLYAAFVGKPVWIEPQRVDYIASEEVLAVDAPAHLEHANVQDMQRLFAEPRSDLSTEQRAFADRLLGVEHVHTPRALAHLLDEAQEIYRDRLTLGRRLRDGARRVQYVRARVKDELRKRWR